MMCFNFSAGWSIGCLIWLCPLSPMDENPQQAAKEVLPHSEISSPGPVYPGRLPGGLAYTDQDVDSAVEAPVSVCPPNMLGKSLA